MVPTLSCLACRHACAWMPATCLHLRAAKSVTILGIVIFPVFQPRCPCGTWMADEHKPICLKLIMCRGGDGGFSAAIALRKDNH